MRHHRPTEGGSAFTATPAESGVEPALVGALRHAGEARPAVVAVLVMRVTSAPLTVSERMLVVTAVAALAENAPAEARSAVAGVSARVLTPLEATVLETAVLEAAVLVLTVLEPARAETVPAEAARTETVTVTASGSVRLEAATEPVPGYVTVTTAPGERRVLVPAERTSELLERRNRGGEIVRGDRVGDLRADAVDDRAETFLGVLALVGQDPGAIGIRHPAELDEPTELVNRDRARAAVDGAVDAVQETPVATRDPEGFEGGGELGGHQSVDRLQPVTKRAGCLLIFRSAVHKGKLIV